MANSVVYFLTDERGRLKVGTTKAIDHRRHSLVAEHGPLELIKSIPGGRTLERRIHKALADYHLVGEWFSDCDAVRTIIASFDPAHDDADVRWSERESKATSEMQGHLAYLEGLCARRGMSLGATHAYLAQKYGIPGWMLWTLKYRPSALPNAALYLLLKDARLTELETYGLELAAECANEPELAPLGAALAAKVAAARARLNAGGAE